MESIIVPAFAIVMLVAPIVCFVWQIQMVRKGHTSRAKGVLRYAVWSLLPLVVFVGFYFALVAGEEVFGVILVGEGYGRSLFVLAGGALMFVVVGTVLFSIAMIFVRNGTN